MGVEGKGVTFNAAGLSTVTKDNPRLNLSGKSAEITAYVVDGEAVSYYQGKAGLKAEGRIITLPTIFPYAPNVPIVNTDDNIRFLQRVANHTMSFVKASFYQYNKNKK